jgi:hypothetical protein
MIGVSGQATKTAYLYATYVLRIIKNGAGGDYSKLLRKAVWDDWWLEPDGYLRRLKNDVAVGTYRTYLHALMSYVKFKQYGGSGGSKVGMLENRIKW